MPKFRQKRCETKYFIAPLFFYLYFGEFLELPFTKIIHYFLSFLAVAFAFVVVAFIAVAFALVVLFLEVTDSAARQARAWQGGQTS